MTSRLLGQRPLTRRRHTGSRGSDGRWTTTYTDHSFLGSLQDLNGRSRSVMPEGARASDYRAVIVTPEFLRTEDQYQQLQADEIIDCQTGEVYVVMGLQRDSGLLPHEYAVLLRRQET